VSPPGGKDTIILIGLSKFMLEAFTDGTIKQQTLKSVINNFIYAS
jgi:hypothetical protein